MQAERIWMLARDAQAALADAQRDMALLATHPSVPADVVAGCDWADLAGDVACAAKLCAAIEALASECRADGEPVEMEEGD